MNESINIAIVDDHKLFKKGLQLALSFYDDVTVLLEAANGSDLLDQLKVSTPEVILLDLRMSEMDGITVLPKLKKEFPQIKVIILSIYDDDTTIKKLKDLGADSFLSKHTDIGEMYQEIRTVAGNDPDEQRFSWLPQGQSLS